MTRKYDLAGAVGWRYKCYEDILKNKRYFPCQSDYNICLYEAYASKVDGQNAIIVFKIVDVDDGHQVTFKEPSNEILSIEQLKECMS